MYKCTECGMEYEVKPDYCDCGNDEFVITAHKEEKPIEKKEPVKPTSAPAPKIPEKVEEVYRPKFELPKVDPISLGIFFVCIVLSIIVILLPVKTNETGVNEENGAAQTKFVKSIPDIDKFWNNAVPIVDHVTPEPVAVKPAEPVKQVAKSVAKPVTKQVAKPVQTKTTPKQTTVKLQKNPAVSTAEQARKAAEAKKKAEAEAKAKAEAEAKAKAEENARKLAEVHKQAADLQQAMSNKMELANYKANLRNTIGRKIDFTKVIGDGDCVISFAIDQSGRLINGAFAKQSSNMTLNDAVYKAFMSSRNFTAPPAGYKNETLRLYVKFYNGNFEISLN